MSDITLKCPNCNLFFIVDKNKLIVEFLGMLFIRGT